MNQSFIESLFGETGGCGCLSVPMPMAHGLRQRGYLLENSGDRQRQEIMIQTASVSVLKVLGEEASCPLPHVLRLFEEAV